MIYDRPYMQSGYGPRYAPVIKWIILTTVAVFVAQVFASFIFRTDLLQRIFELSGENIRRGMLWTPLTYALLHFVPLPPFIGNVSPFFIFHILANMMLVFFIGRVVVEITGPRRMLQLYIAGGFVGALLWLLIHFTRQSSLIGASAAALSLLVFYACVFPNQRITLLVFFVLPINVKPKHIVFFLLALDIFFFLFSELPGAGYTHMAHSAHLGGMLTGWLFHRYVYQRAAAGKRGFFTKDRPLVELPAWFKKRDKLQKGAGGFSVNITNRKALQNEVDRILDKINSDGFGSLTDEEKKLLDRARDLLAK